MTRYAHPARHRSAQYGVGCIVKTVWQLTRSDYGKRGLLIGTDQVNISNIRRICDSDVGGKPRLLLDYTDHPGGDTDPCDFETTWRDRGLLS